LCGEMALLPSVVVAQKAEKVAGAEQEVLAYFQ
jgi:hypothetical protein